MSTVDESSPVPTDEGRQPDGGSMSVDVVESGGAVQKISFYDCDRWNALGMVRSIRVGGGPVVQVSIDLVGICGDDEGNAMVHREGSDQWHPPQDRASSVDRSRASLIEARILDRTKLDDDDHGGPRRRRRWTTRLPRQSDAVEPCARLCDLNDDGIPDIPMSGEDDGCGDGAAPTGRRRSCAAGTVKDAASWVIRRLLPACGGQCAQP